jgi:hypothetical protein
LSQICVTVDPACGADPRKLAFWCQACDQQAFEFSEAWGVDYTPVNYFSWDVLSKLTDAEVAKFVADSRLLTIQPSLDVSGALGFHDDVAGVIFARVMWQGDDTTVTISHEVLEEMGDPTCDEYVTMSHGRLQAKEACDRVEGDTYIETADIGGDTMPVTLSNYLMLPAFHPGSPGPWDRMSRLTSWDAMTDGGYMIVRDDTGNETEVFARTEQGRAAGAQKRLKVGGRVNFRMTQ